MSLKNNGYTFWQEGQELVALHIIHQGAILDGTSIETIYEPSMSEIEKAFEKYNLDVDKAMRIVRSMGKNHHTLFIDVEKFRTHLEGESR